MVEVNCAYKQGGYDQMQKNACTVQSYKFLQIKTESRQAACSYGRTDTTDHIDTHVTHMD